MSLVGNFQVHTEDDHTDLVGLRTLVLSKFWQPSRWPMEIAELDSEEPSPPDVPGGMWLVHRQRRRHGGGLKTFWGFEGINGSGKDVTFKTRRNSPHYGFEPGFAERPIQAHPRIQSMLDECEGQVIDNEIIWPLELGGSVAKGIGRQRGGTGIINPMFGRSSYFSFQGGTYWYRYMVRDEAEIPDIIGKLFKGGLPGGAPRYTGRNWLGAGAPFQRRGPAAIEVVEHYWLSDEGGWPEIIYAKGGA